MCVSIREDVVKHDNEEHLWILHCRRRAETPHEFRQLLVARIVLVVLAVRLRRTSRKLAEVLLLDRLAASPVESPREIRLLPILHLDELVFRDLDSEETPRNVHRDRFVRRNVRREFCRSITRNRLQDVVSSRIYDDKLTTYALELHLVLDAGNGRPARLVACLRKIEVSNREIKP